MIPIDTFNVDKVPSRGEKLARTERELLVSLCQLAEEQLAVSRHIRAALGQTSGESRSHIEVKTSTRGVDVTSKAYESSPMDGLSERAVAEYFATLEAVQARLNGGAEQAKREGAGK